MTKNGARSTNAFSKCFAKSYKNQEKIKKMQTHIILNEYV